MNKSQQILVILIITLISIIGLAIFFSHEETAIVVINRIELQQEVSGSNGSIHTDNFYAIHTSNGMYRIPQSGLYARPNLIGRFKEGDTLTIVSNGYDIPVAGIFKIVKDIK